MSERARALRVQRMNWLAEDVVEVRLVDPDGVPLPAWEPGAHVLLRLTSDLVRQYSLCGEPGDDRAWTIAVHRSPDSRGGSSYVHDRLRVGAVVPVEGPVNNFPLVAADRYLLLAGGIGITPILAMARRLRDSGSDFRLFYCGRSASLMAYRSEVSGWSGGRVTLHADDEHGGPPDFGSLLASGPGTLVYCCGPEAMITAVQQQAPDPRLVRTERFRAAPPPGRAVGDAFDVVLEASGGRVRVEPGQTILEALARVGCEVPSSCREGICGTCETRVIRGEPDHRDCVLTLPERAESGSMMICVSRAVSPVLVLDV